MRGRVTLRQALTFITNHQTDPQIWTHEKITDEYKLKPSVTGLCFCCCCCLYLSKRSFRLFFLLQQTDSILKHFNTFEVYIPEDKAEDKILFKDRVKELWDNKPKTLPPPKYDSDETFDRLVQQHKENDVKKENDKKEKDANQRQIK